MTEEEKRQYINDNVKNPNQKLVDILVTTDFSKIYGQTLKRLLEMEKKL
jgi:chemotaxis regulatin CheY-phosphate phosphatase CheZ